MRFTRFIRKVFATKILLFGMFLLFLTLRTLVSSIMSRIFGPKSFYSKFVQLFTREVIVTGLHQIKSGGRYKIEIDTKNDHFIRGELWLSGKRCQRSCGGKCHNLVFCGKYSICRLSQFDKCEISFDCKMRLPALTFPSKVTKLKKLQNPSL